MGQNRLFEGEQKIVVFHFPQHILTANKHSFTSFSSLSEAEVSKLILSNHPTTCPLDPISSHFFQALSPAVTERGDTEETRSVK